MPRARPGPRSLGLAGILCGLLLIAGGALAAVRALRPHSDSSAVVRAYFTALSRGDAATALGLGRVPAGDRSLLTGAVLAEQQRIAPMRAVVVAPMHTAAATARVPVTYRLGFAGAAQTVHTRVAVVRRDGRWQLDQVAASTRVRLDAAAQRAAVLGGPVPGGAVLMFPGAVPVSLDTTYLRLDPRHAHRELGPPAALTMRVGVSPAGVRDARTTVLKALQTCMTGRDVEPSCPMPTGRVVPGTLRGTVISSALSVTLVRGPAGILRTSGSADLDATVHRLTFTNGWVRTSGRLSVTLHAQAYAVAPLTTVWTRT